MMADARGDYRMLVLGKPMTVDRAQGSLATRDARARATPRVSVARELCVLAPGLCALPPDALDKAPALAQFAAWATHRRAPHGIEAALLDAVRPGALGVAALVARGAGLDGDDAAWLVADPVTLAAGIDDVVVVARVDDLDAAEATAIAAGLDAHFAADGIRILAIHPTRWVMRVPQSPRMTTTPLAAALGGSLYAHRPIGDDARRFERYANEIQMLLHAMPQNEARERAGRAPCNGLWLWDARATHATPAAPRVVADAGRDDLGVLARGLVLATGGAMLNDGRHAAPGAAPAAALLDLAAAHDATHAIVGVPPPTPQTLAQFDTGVLAPALAALRERRIAALTLLADGAGAHAWTAVRPGALRRLRGLLAKPRFALPP
jgi:hypothetical protein